MNADFSRVLSLLRQEKGISQRRGGAARGGPAAPSGKIPLVPAGGAVEQPEHLIQRPAEIRPALGDRLLVVGPAQKVEQHRHRVDQQLFLQLRHDAALQILPALAGVLQLLRLNHGAVPAEAPSTGSGSFNMDIVSADMTLARVKYAKALEEYRGEYPPVDSQSLAEEYQGLSQSMAQVFHSTDERVKKLEGDSACKTVGSAVSILK